MRLSEAIRVGSKLHPQGFGGTQVVAREHSLWCRLGFTKCKQVLTTCALGAAFEAGDCPIIEGSGSAIRGEGGSGLVKVPDDWLTVLHEQQECPQCERRESLFRIIAHLNDDHRWTREEIAVLVERVERKVLVSTPQVVCTAVITEDEEWPSVVGEQQ